MDSSTGAVIMGGGVGLVIGVEPVTTWPAVKIMLIASLLFGGHRVVTTNPPGASPPAAKPAAAEPAP